MTTTRTSRSLRLAIQGFDLVDGAPAARFLNAIRTLVERDYRTVD